jgi:hypothetical protein
MTTKSQARMASVGERGYVAQVGPASRVGAGSIPACFSTSHTVEADAEAGQLAVDPSVSPTGVLLGEPEDEGHE